MIVLTFLLGGVAGAVVYYLVSTHVIASSPRPGPRSSPHNIVDELAKGLSLNAEQRQQLKGIIDQSRERYSALSQQFRPQSAAIRNETRQQIRQILTEEQKARFEKHVKDIDDRHKNHSHKASD